MLSSRIYLPHKIGIHTDGKWTQYHRIASLTKSTYLLDNYVSADQYLAVLPLTKTGSALERERNNISGVIENRVNLALPGMHPGLC